MIFIDAMENVILLMVLTEAESWKFNQGISGVIHMANNMRLSGISLL